jgi:hypothetical protein
MTQTEETGFLPAARLILRKAKGPLSCPEIVRRAQEARILQSQGKTPAKTLYALMERHIRVQGPKSDFVKISPGKYSLAVRGGHVG